LGWPFWGRLAGAPHHLKRLALAIWCSWDYAGNFSTGFKWFHFQLVKLNFGGLAGASHHAKRLALVIYCLWDYAGHLATGYKCLPYQLI